MIIQKLKKSDKIFLYTLFIVYLLTSCNTQKEIKVHRIIKGVLVENFHNYTFNNDLSSVYFTEKDTISVRHISEYDDTENLIKYSIYKSEGVLEYSIDNLMKDTLLFQATEGKSAKDWKFIKNNIITNNKDTLEIENVKNNLGMDILIYRKGNSITIFE